MPKCPSCASDIQPDWDWCYAWFMAGKRLYALYVISKIPAPPDELQRVLDSLKISG